MSQTNTPSYLDRYLIENPMPPDLGISENCELLIYDHSARHDERSQKSISLSKFYLPRNSAYATQRKLIDVEILFIPCLQAIALFSAQLPPSKTKHNRVSSYFSTIVKFAEYVWLNDIYEFSQITHNTIKIFISRLTQGSWRTALNIDDRLIEELEKIETPKHPLFCSTNARKSVNQEAFQKLLSTNISSHELAPYHGAIRNHQFSKGWLDTEPLENDIIPAPLPIKYSSLRQTLEAINLLFFISHSEKIDFLPFPDYIRTAKKLTPAPGRTQNLDGAQAGIMLENSLRILYAHSLAMLKILDVATKHLDKNPKDQKRISTIISSSALPSELKEIYIPDKKNHANAKLNQIIRDILSACFLIIATFNARRRDEVTHKKLGLHRGCCITFDHDLQLYLMTIYIEKSIKDYVPFYVGHATFAAISLLEKLQNLLNRKPWNILNTSFPPNKLETLFRFKRIGSEDKTPSDFVFETFPTGMSYHFLNKICKFSEPPRTTPHMFRRLYCTIYLNQHEYPHLPALSQQLRHEGLEATQIYLTEPNMQSAAVKLGKNYDWNVLNTAYDTHQSEILADLKIAASEKFSEIIFEIVSGTPMSGGYPKFINSIYRRLHRNIRFTALKESEKAAILINKLSIRGHAPSPFRHANCLSGGVRVTSRSRCFDTSDGKLHKERSAPHLCSSCPFSCTSSHHLENLKEDEKLLAIELKNMHNQTLEKINMTKELENLRETIKIHSKKLLG